jgi:chemotaxis protein histidine kinase CheA
MTSTMGEWSADDRTELMKVYYSGACEIVENLQDALLKLEAEPDSVDTLRELKRYVHTLKGDSGSVGLTEPH